ncbi:protein kinase domain-containing protein [Streptomyces sp. NPDC001984]|uniref:serine/threonine-protein kinase n=1 Tax=Streptomyces sp. NPDC002619 TaxID=3364655 RepID=UPI0036753447
MGRVFLGRSLAGRAVAVKIVHPHYAQQTEFKRRFRQEVTAARAVSGAFTAPVVAAGPDDDPPWLATVYVPGPNLAEAVATGGPLPEALLWPLLAGLVEALQAIHAANIVHRDLKPANVLLAEDGPRVIDFGIARAMDATALTGTGVIGTPGFMSPEQVEGETVGPASDVFTLGAVVAFAATGTGPFGEGSHLALLHRVIHTEPHIDGVPGPLRGLVAACLDKDPAQRPTLAALAGTIADRWTPPEEFPGVVPWPAAVTRLIKSRQTPAPGAPIVAMQPDEAAAHPPTERVSKTLSPEELSRGLVNYVRHLAEDRARVLAPDHPDTLTMRYNHARYAGDEGDPAQAALLLADLTADYARVLGSDHTDTLNSRHWHAHYVGEAGDPAQAAELMADVTAHCARVVGPHNPGTLRSRYWHALYVGRTGDLVQATRLMADVTAHCARVMGPDNPDTLRSRHDHARLTGEAGNPAEAARLMALVAADRTRVLGTDHPATQTSRHQLAHWQKHAALH